MKTFMSDGIELAYIDKPAVGEFAAGSGATAERIILLIHGFASSVAMNWIGPGWVNFLTQAGYRVVAFDNRGHGDSQKLYELSDYGAELMAEDARRLLDQLHIERADVMGYSMGARISAFLAINHPLRARSVIFGGLGGNLLRPMPGTDMIADALEAKTIDDVTDPIGQTFRRFAEQTGSDLRALTACMRSGRHPITKQMIGKLQCPALVAVGSKDDIAGSATELAAVLPQGEVLEITGRDHMRAVGDIQYKQGVLAFLQRRA